MAEEGGFAAPRLRATLTGFAASKLARFARKCPLDISALAGSNPRMDHVTKKPPLLGAEQTYGGGGGIRTPVTLAGQTVFETAAFNHSATPPDKRGAPQAPR